MLWLRIVHSLLELRFRIEFCKWGEVHCRETIDPINPLPIHIGPVNQGLVPVPDDFDGGAGVND